MPEKANLCPKSQVDPTGRRYSVLSESFEGITRG